MSGTSCYNKGLLKGRGRLRWVSVLLGVDVGCSAEFAAQNGAVVNRNGGRLESFLLK